MEGSQTNIVRPKLSQIQSQVRPRAVKGVIIAIALYLTEPTTMSSYRILSSKSLNWKLRITKMKHSTTSERI